MRIKVSEITIPEKRLHTINPDRVADIADSIRINGLIHQIVVRKVNDKYVLVCGAHRLEALKLLGNLEVEERP